MIVKKYEIRSMKKFDKQFSFNEKYNNFLHKIFDKIVTNLI